MTSRSARRIYAFVVHLHPAGFRQSFGREMIYAFDEGVETYGPAWLLADAAMSLGRQWLVRPSDASGLEGANERIGLMAGTYPMLRPPHLTAGKLLGACLLSILLVALIQPYQVDGRLLGKEVRYELAQAKLLGWFR